MQERKRTNLSRWRLKLLELYHSDPKELAPFLSSHPLTKGTVYTLRRKCSKPTCHCARGELHENVVLTASIGGKTRLWTISKDRITEIRQQTERYRRFRQARSRLVKESAKRQAAMLRLIDKIEKYREQVP
jgi:hypothetical protein